MPELAEPMVAPREVCPNCNAKMSGDEDFCSACGQLFMICVCPSCLADNLPRAQFCHACDRPLDSIAFNNPFMRIFSHGWFLREISRRAEKGKVNRLLVWGTALAFAPYALFVGWVLLYEARFLELLQYGWYGWGVRGNFLKLAYLVVPMGYCILIAKVLFAHLSRKDDHDAEYDVSDDSPG